METTPPESVSFESLGVPSNICESLQNIGWAKPTPIQQRVIPNALANHDIVALAETGSGKTGAFVLPTIVFLLHSPSRFFAVVIVPTRELSLQICEVFEALGSNVGLVAMSVVGGISMVDQAVQLAKGPHVLVCTPGRLVDHLQNTKGFSLRNTKIIVLDEADRLLSMDFEKEISYIFSIAKNRSQCYLFSATMTKKVALLKKSFLSNPVEISVAEQFQIPKNLIQQYVFLPAKWKDCYLYYFAQVFDGQSIIIFTSTCQGSFRLMTFLNDLGFDVTCLHGQMPQVKRINAINRFRGRKSSILVATDVASRGLDIPDVDVVINFDLPMNGKNYVHRVGRTARSGKSGRSISFVTQYDIEAFQNLESLLNTKLCEYPVEEAAVLLNCEKVESAQRNAIQLLRESAEFGRKRKDFGKFAKDPDGESKRKRLKR